MWRHVTKISSLSRGEVERVLNLALEMKRSPSSFGATLAQQSLLMLFEKPSLRTRVSLEVGMTQLGGHGIAYMLGDSPLGTKETYEDTGEVLTRMAQGVTARVKSRAQIRGLARASRIPVVNALDDFAHPMQMLADLLTICERKCAGDVSKLRDVTLAFVGDVQNNVTYDLARSGAVMGFEVRVGGPLQEYPMEAEVLRECAVLGKLPVVCSTAEEAVDGADVVYTDSWMSYGTSEADKAKRLATFLPFQVTDDLMALAKPDAAFMNCLPAMRGEEQTAAVIDGPQSIVFDQAENRLHAQKALLALLMNRQL